MTPEEAYQKVLEMILTDDADVFARLKFTGAEYGLVYDPRIPKAFLDAFAEEDDQIARVCQLHA